GIRLGATADPAPGGPEAIAPSCEAGSYAALAPRAGRYGQGPWSRAPRKGACVAGMMPNSTEALALFFAAIQTGLYMVPVNWHLTAAEVAYILADSEARAF